MTKLDNCPFCGGKAVFNMVSQFAKGSETGFYFRITCNNCGVKQPQEGAISVTLENDGTLRYLKDDRLDLAVLWNTRADYKEAADV